MNFLPLKTSENQGVKNENTGPKWVDPFLPNIPFSSPWKHQKTSGFLFSGVTKGKIGKKMINDKAFGLRGPIQ